MGGRGTEKTDMDEAARSARKARIESLLFRSSTDAVKAKVTPPSSPTKKALSAVQADPLKQQSVQTPSSPLKVRTKTAKSRRRQNQRSASLPPGADRSTSLEAARTAFEADRDALRKSELRRQNDPVVLLEKHRPQRGLQRNCSTKGTSIVLLGPVNSGKTLIIQTFCTGMARLRPPPTVGVERHDVVSSTGELRVWDTSGNARFDEAALALIGTASAVIVVWAHGDSASLESATRRLDRAKSEAPEMAAFALVATRLSRSQAVDDEDPLQVEARRVAARADALVFNVVADDLSEIASLFGDVVDAANSRKLAHDRALRAVRRKSALAAADAAENLVDLELNCYYLALFFILLGMPLAG